MRFFVTEIAGPVARRVGAFLSGYLVSVGMDADLATQVEAVTIASALFAVDLLVSHWYRKSSK